MSERLDPGHGARKSEISGKARRATLAGLALAAVGAALFAIAPLLMIGGMGASMASAEPSAGAAIAGLGAASMASMSGILLMAAGGFTSMIAGFVWLGSRSGDIARYAAAEHVPVAADVARETAHVRADVIRTVAPAQADAVKQIVRGAREGWREGGGPSGEPS